MINRLHAVARREPGDRFMTHRPRIDQGFTLIELLVVVAIIVALIAILLPAMGRAIDAATIATCGSNQHQIHTSVLNYAASNRGIIPPMNGQRGNNQTINHWPRWFLEPNVNTPWNLGYLFVNDYVQAGELFFCPAATNPAKSYDGHDDPVFPQARTCSGCANGVRLSYFYNPMTQSVSNRNRKYQSVATIDASMLMLTCDVESAASVTHVSYPGWNVAAGDGSVGFAQSQAIYDDIEAGGGGMGGTNFSLFDDILERLMSER